MDSIPGATCTACLVTILQSTPRDCKYFNTSRARNKYPAPQMPIVTRFATGDYSPPLPDSSESGKVRPPAAGMTLQSFEMLSSASFNC